MRWTPPPPLALYEAFLAFDADPEARVAVFHGDHGHFCAGWDLQAAARVLAQSPDAAQVLASTRSTSTRPIVPVQGPMGPSRLLLSKPVIAAVSGAAVAGGMELALWCDMRVMEEDAYFGVYCRRFGVPLIDGGTVRLPRLIGMGHAMDLILTGRKVEPAEALQMGLVQPGRCHAAGRWRRRWNWRRNWRLFRRPRCGPTAPAPMRSGTCRWRRRCTRSGSAARPAWAMPCRAPRGLPPGPGGTAKF